MRPQKAQKTGMMCKKRESTSQMRSQKGQTTGKHFKHAFTHTAGNGKALPKCVPKKGKQRARVFDRSFPFRAFIEGPF